VPPKRRSTTLNKPEDGVSFHVLRREVKFSVCHIYLNPKCRKEDKSDIRREKQAFVPTETRFVQEGG
jgi:hypothetical protein